MAAKPRTKEWNQQVGKLVATTATKIASELDAMLRKLPQEASPNMALQALGGELNKRERKLMAPLILGALGQNRPGTLMALGR
jgi:hypothetical protein